MWHKIENIAEDHFLNPKTFKDFCLDVCQNDCADGFIHGMNIDLVIVRYRQAGFKERLIPANDNT